MNASRRTSRLQEIGDESRRRILDAAEELFATKGFEGTSFADIAARAGISRGSIPWHFQNKHGLLMAVVTRMADQYLAAVTGGTGLEEMRQAMGRTRDLLTTGSASLIYTLLTEALVPDSPVREQYQRMWATNRQLVLGWIDDSPLAPSVGRARDLATVAFGAVLGIDLQWRLDPDNIDLDASLSTVLALMALATGTEADISLPPAGDHTEDC